MDIGRTSPGSGIGGKMKKQLRVLVGLVVILMALGLYMAQADAQEKKRTHQDEMCLVLLEDRIAARNLLEAYRITFREIIRRHEDGEMSDEDYASYERIWNKTEVELLDEIAVISIKAQLLGCFAKK